MIILDIGGQTEFREYRRKYLNDVDITLIVFALNDPISYNVDEFIDDILEMPARPTFALLGNKLDLCEKEDLDLSVINVASERHDVPVYFTSAKEDIMIREMFLDVIGRESRLAR